MIEFRGVGKNFGPRAVLDAACLDAGCGESLVLLGPSGAGKTTVLRLIAGLDVPDRGEVWIDGRMASSCEVLVHPSERKIGMVFQHQALWPHMNVAETLAFSGGTGARLDAATQELIEELQLASLRGKYPHELSGGERQRLAIARALSRRPQILLLDEPLSYLDWEARASVLSCLKRLRCERAICMVTVTHDLQEALLVGDRWLRLRDGRLFSVDPNHMLSAVAA